MDTAQKFSNRTGVRFCFAVFLAMLMFIFRAPTSQANTPIPVAVVTCPACATADELHLEAETYWTTYHEATPPGYAGVLQDAGICTSSTKTSPSMVFVVSTQIAISAAFYACWDSPHGVPSIHVIALNGTSNADAVATDNVVLARDAAQSGPFVLPSNLPLSGAGGSAPDVLIESYLSSAYGFVLNGLTATPWHGLLNFPQVEEGTFENMQTGQTFTIYSGDTITVTDSNGWSARFQWNPGVSPPWQLVPNSIRDANGHPVASLDPNGPSPGGAVEPSGAIDVTLSGTGGSILIWPLQGGGSSLTGTISVGPVTPTGPGTVTECTTEVGGECTITYQ